MSDGGYSRIEKDFLGNERMVHYDASGNMLGASDVIREPDGTIRISNDTSPTYQAGELPHVVVIEPKPNADQVKVAAPVDVHVTGIGPKPNTANRSVMIFIATFIIACILTLGVMSFLKTREGRGSNFSNVPSYTTPTRETPPITDTPTPRSNPDDYPSDPKPRNDQQPGDIPPVDNGAPDSNMDDNHPRINDATNAPADDSTPKTEPKPKKGSDDPIDLRGDDSGQKDPAKKGSTTGGDPLKGDDIH